MVAPDTWSGYGGVINRGPIPAVARGSDGSNSGVHVGSVLRIAVIGRQKFQWYLSFQALMMASAAERSSRANRRALSVSHVERELVDEPARHGVVVRRWIRLPVRRRVCLVVSACGAVYLAE